MFKIKAPLHDAQDCQALVDAGAQELYCGVLGDGKVFLNYMANHRETCLPDMDSLRGVVRCAAKGDVPVYLCLNSYVEDKNRPLQIRQAEQGLACGVSGIILSDISLVGEIRRLGPKVKIILSTLAVSTNSEAVKLYSKLGVDRISLERQLSIAEISEISHVAASLGVEGCVKISGVN